MDRRDYLYAPSHVAPAFRPLFEYLQAALGARYEVWVRVEDFGRTLGAGVVNPSSRHWFSVMGMAQCRRLAGKPSYYGYSIIDPIHPEMRSMTWNCYRSNAQRATLLS